MKLYIKREIIDSLLLAFLINIKLINQVVISVIPGLKGKALILLYLCIVAFLVVSVIMSGKYSVKRKMLLFVAVLLAAYIISFLIYGSRLSISPYMFVCYVILPFFVFREYNVKLVLKLTIWLAVIAAPFLGRIMSYSENTSAMNMGTAYIFLSTTAAALIYAYYYGEWKRNAIAYIVNLYCLIRLFGHGSRGVLMSLIILVALLIILKYDSENRCIKIKWNKMTVFLIAVIISAIFFEELLLLMQGLLARFNLSARFITKCLILLESDNLGNGRAAFIHAGLQGFLKSPIWGNGIASFSYLNNGMNYPHNAIVQALHDGGVLLAGFLLWTGFDGSKKMLADCSRDKFIMWLFLFSVCIPGSMVSHELWGTGPWLFFSLLVNFSREDRYELPEIKLNETVRKGE